MYKFLIVSALAALSLAGADLTGKWKGEAKRPDGTTQSTVILDLKQDGEKVTGTVGRDESETTPIENVKLSGDKLTFEINGGSSLYKVTLTPDGESALKGTVIRNRDGQDSPAMPMELTRQK